MYSKPYFKLSILKDYISFQDLLLQNSTYTFNYWELRETGQKFKGETYLSYFKVMELFEIEDIEFEKYCRSKAINKIKKQLVVKRKKTHIDKIKTESYNDSKIYNKTYPIRRKSKTRQDFKKYKTEVEKLEKYSTKQDPNERKWWYW